MSDLMNVAEEKFQSIYEDVLKNINNIISEEDAKIQIINRIFTECLGWAHSDIKAETKHDSGFSDYIFLDADKRVLLVEAKRIGLIDIDVAENTKVRHLKISGSSLKTASEGINQAYSYAAPNGLPIAVLTDGISWIVFKTYILGENYKDKEAIVFPSLDAIKNDFSQFYDLLAKQQFGKRLYNGIFDNIHQNRLVLERSLYSPIEPRNIKLSAKEGIAFDLDRIFTNFFAKLTGDEDEELLIECFVETRASQIADFSLEKMTTNILGNMLPSDRDVNAELASLIQESVESDVSAESGETVFIVGPTGAGKSTFLDRFFRKTLPRAVRKQCVLVKVNCLDATGREDTALEWITEYVISCLEKEIYSNGSPSWDELMGMYISEYRKRAEGVDAQLYKRDKAAFKEKFGVYLEERVEKSREEYLKRLLSDAVSNRKLLPVFVIDNTDEFTNDYKQKIFQFSQALKRHAKHCLIIFPITDKSAWSFSKTDIYGIYKSRSFFLPTPSPREVFRKRIDFIKKQIDMDGQTKNKGKYFLKKGIRISIENLNSFAKILEDVFVNHDYTSKTIGELTNYNIRRTLLLSQRVMTSPVLNIEDLIKASVTGEFSTNFNRFMEALMRGDYDFYKVEDNHEIYPIFRMDTQVKQSPLLALRVLALLESLRNSARSIEDQHMEVQSIVSYFDTMAVPEISINRTLLILLEAGLIEPYDVSYRDLSVNQKFSISYKGMAHLRLASFNSVFFHQMALTTAIPDKDLALKILSIHKSSIPFLTKVADIKKAFYEFLISEDSLYVKIPIGLPQYESQEGLIRDLSKFGNAPYEANTAEVEFTAVLGGHYKEGVVQEGVVASVEWYDAKKGYGFVEVDGIDTSVFIHAEKLNEYGLKHINEGDEILCDVHRNAKGFYIEKIHDIGSKEKEVETETRDCQVVRIFADRGYGFANIKGTPKDAYFRLSLFGDSIESVSNGFEFKADVRQDKKRYWS